MTDEGSHGQPMDAARWARVGELFRAALDLPPDEREGFITRTAGEDTDLAREVRELLDAHDESDTSFADALDVGRAAALLDESAGAPGPGSRVGPYIVDGVLGRGGMAVVYRAHDPRLDRPVALKLLSPALSGSPDAKARLVAEARAASALDHPNIATIHDIGETEDGRVWFAMARYDGESLANRIAHGPLPPDEVLLLGRQIASGLAAAHDRGIVHRDIKPANIIITGDGDAKILDFGIAKASGVELTRAGTTLGTVAYMSPEQTRGQAVDARSDVWSLGVVLYEALCGRRPFEGDDDSVVIHGIRHDRPMPAQEVNPTVPASLSATIERCLEKSPDRRWSSMRELAASLAGGASGSAMALPAGVAGRSVRSRRRAAMAILAVLAALWLGRSFLASDTPAPSSTLLLVLPFRAATPDAELDRLGSDLAVTLSRTLDGFAQMRSLDPVSVVPSRSRPVSAGAADLAARTGAGRYLEGSIVRAGDSVRVDAAIHDAARDGAVLARATVTGSADDITRLTDDIAVTLLRELLGADRAPVPSLAALTTRSPAALRAYLEGERAIAESRFLDAPAFFETAIREDSTFWFAYWRLMYARAWNDLPVDSVVVATVRSHLSTFPEVDRLLAAARFAPTEEERVTLLRDATMRHPAPWQSWFDLGDWLHHDGPYHGFTQADARAAFEAALDRNPDLLPALEHLFRIGVMTRDSALTASTLARMTMIGADSMRAGELGYDVLLYYRYLDHLARSGGRPHPALADTGAAMLATLRSRTSHVVLSSSLSMLGFGAAQIDFLDRIATHQPASDIVTAHLYGRSVAWAQRGAWDSALVAAGAFAQAADPLTPELLPRQIAAVGRLLGTLDAERISEVMRTGPAMARGAAPAITAEIAWLDGITAYAAGDTEAMHAAIRSLDGLAGYAPASPLRRMLGALAAAARGNTSAAADSLLAIEHEIASGASYRPIGQRHPWFGAVSRLLAARWLLSEGDTAQASRLLTWHEAVLPSDLRRVQDANFALSTFALVEQAAIAEARGDTGSAARFRVRFLDLLDAPVQQLTPLVRATRTSLARDPGGR